MKKLFYLLSSAALLFGAASCDKGDVEENIVPEVKKTSIVLNATIADDTRTTLDGKKVDWAEGDCIYLVTSDKTWGKPYVSSSDTQITTIAEYVYSGGAFTDQSDANLPALTEGTDYTVHAMYARADQKTYHRGAATSHRLLATQSQDCANPTAHIATNDALVGKFTVTGGAVNTVDVTMNHIYTMMEVDVKNTTGKEIEITKFEMEAAGATLAGDFTVNYGNTLVPVDVTFKDYGYDMITVNVANGTVANNGTLPIYFVMAPLTDYSGDVTFTVTDSEGYVYTKTVAVEEISFEAGKYNTTGYTISEGEVPFALSGDYVIVGLNQEVYCALSSDADGSRRAYKALDDYGAFASAEGYPTDDEKIIWNIQRVSGGFTIKNGDNYLSWNSGAVANLSSEEYVVAIAQNDNGTYTIKSHDETRVFAKNADNQYGYAFYALSTNGVKELYLKPVVADTRSQLAAPVLTINNITDAGFTVSWNAVDNAVQYVVTCDGKSVKTDETSCVISELKSGTEYAVTVTAIPSDYTLYRSATASTTATTKAAAGSGKTYTKITTVDELSDGKYLIVYEEGGLAANGSKNVSTSSGGIGYNASNVNVVINANTIAGSDEIDNAVVTIAKSGDKYTVQNAAGDYMNSAANTNGYTKNATADNQHLCAISFDANNNAVIANFDGSTHLTINKNNGSPLFRFYKVSTLTGSNASKYAYPALYKLVE